MNASLAGLLLILLSAGCTAPSSSPDLGAAAPDFELWDVDGRSIRLSALRGAPVLLELFGVHCGSCRAMMGQLLPYHDEFGEPGRVRMISVDLGERFDGLGAQGEDEVRAWRSEFGANWTFAADANHTVANLYRVIARPSLYLIDAEGRLAWEQGGYVPLAVLRTQTEKVLA